MAKYKEGDRIVFGRHKKNKGLQEEITIGKIYTVKSDGDTTYFLDNDGDRRFVWLLDDSSVKITKIVD